MAQVISTEPAISHPANPPATEPSVEVFAVYGVEPEIQAYAMAKYSRSSLSMKESLKEITLQKAEKFLNTFYFQYWNHHFAEKKKLHEKLCKNRVFVKLMLPVLNLNHDIN